MILAACQEPADIKVFIENREVKEIIAAYNETVIIEPGSDSGLIAGYRKISGLDPNKYYMVEKEYEFTGGELGGYPKFVTESPLLTPGQLWTNISFITKIRGRTITGLTNNNRYIVNSAVLFSGTGITFTDDNHSNAPVTVTADGIIEITNAAGDGKLNFNGALTGTYDVMAVANPSPPGSSWMSGSLPTMMGNNSTWNAFALEGPGTTVDYVFFHKTTHEFKVLTVKIVPVDDSSGYGISLLPTGSQILTATYGYVTAPEITGTITNTGSKATGALSINVSGTTNFEVSPLSIPDIAVSNNNTFTVKPKTGLDAATYNATVTVSGINVVSKTFDVSFTVNKKTIDIAAILGVTKPVTGAVPVTAITEADQYTGSVEWKNTSTSVPLTGNFAAGTGYTATITLTPKANYTLTGVAGGFFTVADATSVANAADSGVITAVFPATASSGSTGVELSITFTVTDANIDIAYFNGSNVDITSLVPTVTYKKIVDGDLYIVLTLDGSGYTGITWDLDGTTIPSATSNKLTINSSSSILNKLVTGTHYLNVRYTKGSQTYNKYVTINVSNN